MDGKLEKVQEVAGRRLGLKLLDDINADPIVVPAAREPFLSLATGLTFRNPSGSRVSRVDLVDL